MTAARSARDASGSASAPSRNNVELPARLSTIRRALALLLTWFVRALLSTYRVELAGPDPPGARPLLFTFHHGRQLPLLRHPRPERLAVLASLSRDGSLQARVLSAMGFEIVRGSSSRGGAEGLLALVRRIRDGASAALAVDGPRGPAGEVKPGALFLARATGALVVPIACAARRTIVLRRSWDRFVIPLPWTKVVLVRGEALEVERHVDTAGLEQGRGRLERSLRCLTERADSMIADEGRRRENDSPVADRGREQEQCTESSR